MSRLSELIELKATMDASRVSSVSEEVLDESSEEAMLAKRHKELVARKKATGTCKVSGDKKVNEEILDEDSEEAMLAKRHKELVARKKATGTCKVSAEK